MTREEVGKFLLQFRLFIETVAPTYQVTGNLMEVIDWLGNNVSSPSDGHFLSLADVAACARVLINEHVIVKFTRSVGVQTGAPSLSLDQSC